MTHGEQEITIKFNLDDLSRYEDRYLAMLWHLAQANPADGFRNRAPGEIAMKIGWEIIGRWLHEVEPEMYHHQQDHYSHWVAGLFAHYVPVDEDKPNGPRRWALRPDYAERVAEFYGEDRKAADTAKE